MVDGIGSGTGGGGGLSGLNLLKAEVARLRERATDLRSGAVGGEIGAGSMGVGADRAEAGKDLSQSFAATVREELGAVDKAVQSAGSLHVDAVKGELDFHEVATRVKQAELTFDFAMQVRNKLIDAYREVMRMSV